MNEDKDEKPGEFGKSVVLLNYEEWKNMINRLDEMLKRAESINMKCDENMKRLNNMMLELKGCIAMVRPSAKKNEWYGEELEGKEAKEPLEIELNS